MSSNIRINAKCDFCGNDFIAKTTRTRYCSHTCNSRDYKRRTRNQKIKDFKKTNSIKSQANSLEDVKSKEFLNVKDVAVIMGCSTRTIYRLINDGTIKAVNLSERLIRVNRKSLENVIPE